MNIITFPFDVENQIEIANSITFSIIMLIKCTPLILIKKIFFTMRASLNVTLIVAQKKREKQYKKCK